MVRTYTPPSINQTPPSQRTNNPLQTGSHPGLGERTTAPNARDSHWNLIENVRYPFDHFADSKDFGFWFNYFWAEAVEAPKLTPAQKVKISESFFSVFQQAPNLPSFVVRPDFATRGSDFKENVLRQLLIIGFERVAVDSPERFEPSDGPAPNMVGRPPARMPRVIVDAAALSLAPLQAGGKDWMIAFRCDSRSYEEVNSDGGFNTRARSQKEWLRQNYALDQPWHPYSNPVYRNSLFLRRGSTNRDNCLHTVISVGTNFHMTTHFPLLNDPLNFDARSPITKDFLCIKPFDEWTKADIQTATGHRQKLHVFMNYSAGIVDHIEKVNHVHVMYLNGLKGVNTEAAISGPVAFPERGMESVPSDHLLADVEFVQKYWFNERRGKIMLYELEFKPVAWKPSERVIESLLGTTAKTELLAQIHQEITLSNARAEIRLEGEERRRYIASASTRLTREERLDVLKLLKAYIAANPNSIGKQQKAYIKGLRARLAAKIDAVGPLDWKAMQSKAKSS